MFSHDGSNIKQLARHLGGDERDDRGDPSLLSAEMANKLDDDPDRARSDYDEAIDLAGRHKYVHDQAIACELASLFHRAQLRPTQAEEYLQRARLHYGDWGACAKVDLL